jgi:hypothetical protein
VLAVDPRPPVVYLRPFQQEEETLAQLPWRWRDFWANAVRSITRRRKWLSLTLEEFLGNEISARIGPFIAFGNPIDFVPPEGAARTYVADEEWTKHFEEMVRGARCIVMMAAVSENVMWELAQIRKLGLQPKLFVLTKPRLRRKTVPLAWGSFAFALQRAGYRPCREDPGPGASVGFDDGGQVIILKRDARSAAETTDALCDRVGLQPTGTP